MRWKRERNSVRVQREGARLGMRVDLVLWEGSCTEAIVSETGIPNRHLIQVFKEFKHCFGLSVSTVILQTYHSFLSEVERLSPLLPLVSVVSNTLAYDDALYNGDSLTYVILCSTVSRLLTTVSIDGRSTPRSSRQCYVRIMWLPSTQ
ncbi:uncharacterized protein LOC130768477 isoform X2 [Actinidia eriantha]|uniref:uncharacterized protein LOC130768477 isoform X2 n=1 Tax=Actinidia eriantha TaxID=165200 RepID=UPI002585DB09|nr:uncharacterized protein LOC130768477 isoform X2 [Actinidia eriantha]